MQGDRAATRDGGPLFKVRYVQVVLLFFLMTIAFSIRMTLSVAIVAMTHNGTSSNPDVPTYEWKNTNIILSSFFWSYAITQFFAGHMAQVYGPKWLLATAMLANALASIAIPSFVNYFGANGVITCRIFQGLFQGFMLPLTHNMLGRWAPSHENSWINATVYTGCSVGGIIAMLFTGYLSASPLGWPSAFYFFGTLGLIWCLFWTCLSADSPATHKTITTEERKYIEISLGQENDHMMEEKSIPWKAIFTSVPYWAIIIAAVGESWGSTLLGTELPTYLSSVVGLDIEELVLGSSDDRFDNIRPPVRAASGLRYQKPICVQGKCETNFPRDRLFRSGIDDGVLILRRRQVRDRHPSDNGRERNRRIELRPLGQSYRHIAPIFGNIGGNSERCRTVRRHTCPTASAFHCQR
ncbi:vesicular glutamate transporter 2-like isoform X4 [Cylas formicarius]|uniref:vesicular glutamate transporter 2-like isoform X4 n=1 Tax=Cylas formicarius TaxID=197179 RepID=UPI002958C1BC|nr:vesicular glutamate transporter 2-like isoform X4 [Cylas formicarius]